jgi:hypothetical protein
MQKALIGTLTVLLPIVLCHSTRGEESMAEPLISPQPRTASWEGKATVIARSGVPVRINAGGEGGGAAAGVRLLMRRLEALGFQAAAAASTEADVSVVPIGWDRMARLIGDGDRGVTKPASGQIRQAYLLVIGEGGGARPAVRIDSADPLGMYYGLLTLIQVLDTDGDGNLVAPAGEVIDYPEVGIRLGKTSASMSDAEDIERFASWMAINRVSHLGLQYHGRNSKDPERPFEENVQRFCAEFERKGTLDTVVYFCPFRGAVTGATGSYDFQKQADREAYVEYLRWIMGQGADGIEVDYNDWPGNPEIPISDVLNLAFETVTQARPDALVLYCPPNRGEESYRGMATEHLTNTLSKVPARSWPLWTGMQTLIKEPLTDEVVLEWTEKAGRRPFLWVNRVGPAVREPFVQRVDGDPEWLVFAGDFLPNDLGRLFEGVHLNAGLQAGYNQIKGEFSEESLVYLATTADYLWNPKAWNPEESLRRARRFVEIVEPLMAVEGQ